MYWNETKTVNVMSFNYILTHKFSNKHCFLRENNRKIYFHDMLFHQIKNGKCERAKSRNLNTCGAIIWCSYHYMLPLYFWNLQVSFVDEMVNLFCYQDRNDYYLCWYIYFLLVWFVHIFCIFVCGNILMGGSISLYFFFVFLRTNGS